MSLLTGGSRRNIPGPIAYQRGQFRRPIGAQSTNLDSSSGARLSPLLRKPEDTD